MPRYTPGLRPTPGKTHIYPTEAELLGADDADGTIAYAIDAGLFYGKVAGTWKPLLTGGAEGFGILGFAGNDSQSEVGETLTNPSFAASYSAAPDSASVQDDQGNPSADVSATPNAFSYAYAYTKTANNAVVVFTLQATKGVDTDNATTSAVWQPRVFWGVGLAGLSTEADIEGLANQPLRGSRAITFTASPGANEYIYFAAPTSYGAPTFTVEGFPGGFDFVATVSVTNGFGVTQNYDLYKSTNPNLGSTTVQVS